MHGPGYPLSPSLLTVVAVLTLTGVFVGCERETQAPAPPAAVEVTVVKAEPRDTPVTFELVGRTASSRRVEIRSRVEGFLEKQLYEEGSLVEEGQALFQIDRKPFEAQLQAARAALSQQKARLDNAEDELERITELREQNVVARKEYVDAVSTQRLCVAAVEEATANVVQAELDLGYTTVTTPVTGLSSFAVQQEGAYIGVVSGALLTYVAQLDPIWIEFSVSENQLLRSRAQEREGLLTVPESGDYEVEVVLADGTVYPHTGRITFADASISEETGTFLLRAELQNPESTLRPGQFVRIRIKGAYRPNAILVPQRAVQQAAQGSFVWVVDESSNAEFRPIVAGDWHGNDWFVNEGLNAGDTVVVDGAVKLRAGVPVKIVEPTEAPQPSAGSQASATGPTN
jgi:membrane fusion protein (multidrug efflux system)